MHSVNDMTTTQIDVTLVPAPAVRVWPRLVADTRYVATGLPVAVVAAVVCLTGVAVGAGLAVVAVGLPLLLAAMLKARAFARAERERIASVLDEPVHEPAYRTAGAGMCAGAGTDDNLLRRLWAVLRDPQSWRDLTHATFRFIPSTIGFSFVVSWWAVVLGGTTWGLWGWALPSGPDYQELPELLGLGDAYLTNVGFYLITAAIFAATLPAVARAWALLEARFARSLLASRSAAS